MKKEKRTVLQRINYNNSQYKVSKCMVMMNYSNPLCACAPRVKKDILT